jgi:hypothetical protein
MHQHHVVDGLRGDAQSLLCGSAFIDPPRQRLIPEDPKRFAALQLDFIAR